MSGKDFATIEGRALVPALKLMTQLVEKRNTYPVLGMVRLMASGSTLTLRATDLDVELTATLDLIDKDEAGDWGICVDAGILLKIAMFAGSTTLELDYGAPTRLDIRAGHVAYVLDGLAHDTHPEVPGTSGPAIETFAPRKLRDLLGKVAWCQSLEETRYYLNGVAWQFSDRGRRFVATDGHRLALCRYDDLPVAGIGVTRIIPTKAVALLSELPGEVVMRSMVNPKTGEPDTLKLEAVAGDMTLRIKLIEGSGTIGGYPDVDRVIPGENMRKSRFATRRDVLLDAVQRALIFDDRRGSGRCLAFSNVDGNVSIGAKRADAGGATVVLPDVWPEGAERFGLNGRYLRDLVRSCAPGELSLWQVDAKYPLTVLDSDTTMLRLVMPMRVD